MNIDTINRATPRQAREYMKDIIEAGQVPYLKSSPGLGKSTIVRSVYDEFGLKLIDHRLSTSGPEDFNGYPFPDEITGKAKFMPFSLFPLASDPIPKNYDGFGIFFDEFNHAVKTVAAASYKVLLERMVGQFPLHPRTAITLAGNLMTDRALVNIQGTALQSRVIHINMIADLMEWVEDVAIPQEYDERIIAYMMYRGVDYLMDFDPDHKNDTFACPRTWEFMNALIKGKTFAYDPGTGDYAMDRKIPLYAGAITPGKATDFVQFTKVFHNLVTIEQVVQDPTRTRVPEHGQEAWAAMAHLAGKTEDSNFDKVVLYINRFELRHRVIFFRTIKHRHPKLRQHPAFISGLVEITKYLNGN